MGRVSGAIASAAQSHGAEIITDVVSKIPTWCINSICDNRTLKSKVILCNCFDNIMCNNFSC